jgi:bifunctional non-homologous end joining protein LigD
MQTERAELYFRQGSSDKVYHLQLENVDDKWSVEAQWGRRGSALQSDVKANGVPYEEAKRVYDRILREKTGKGYQIAQATTNGDAPISVGLPASKEQSGHVPELLTPIEEPEALLLAQDASWWFQQKFDGRRLAVQKADGKYSGINKLGQTIPIDSRLSEPLDHVQAKAFLADGEITDSHFYIWDLLSVNDTDLRTEPYEIRYVHLTRLFRGVHQTLRVCETAMTPKAKRAFVKAMHDANAEGFVCKNRYATYAAGPAGQHFKCKFVATASFIVGPKPDKNQMAISGAKPYLFPSDLNPTGHLKKLKTVWTKTLRRAKIPYFRIYDLRSAYATRLSAGGVADEWVTQLLRQSDAQVFKKYSQMKLRMKREALEKLNRRANEMVPTQADTLTTAPLCTEVIQ